VHSGSSRQGKEKRTGRRSAAEAVWWPQTIRSGEDEEKKKMYVLVLRLVKSKAIKKWMARKRETAKKRK